MGVARTTVTSWANHNVHFIVEHNLRRTARLEASADRLHSLVLKALLLVESEIDGGDVGSALALLKLVGVDHLSTAGMPGACSLLGAENERGLLNPSPYKFCQSAVIPRISTGVSIFDTPRISRSQQNCSK